MTLGNWNGPLPLSETDRIKDGSLTLSLGSELNTPSQAQDHLDRISNGMKEVTPGGERFQEEGRGNQRAADRDPSLLIWVRPS